MQLPQRFKDEQPHPANGEGGTDSHDLLQQLRSDADRLLAAGDEAIKRALAGTDSEKFLRANRQQGGE